ncbi:PREDICTED: uncharacterized protein LOC104698685 [Camelina sativa]|uniref:Uncharacterized protein LOC104698685 n=1 Tax=Camelina sativa TaxID=90675 RepID=A0ABM0SKD4_CAMSA|nr:PREDICTED: uncharacterized protein LOC104698685 [Camelina sativa]
MNALILVPYSEDSSSAEKTQGQNDESFGTACDVNLGESEETESDEPTVGSSIDQVLKSQKGKEPELSGDEIDPTGISVQEQFERLARKKRVHKNLGPPKKSRKTGGSSSTHTKSTSKFDPKVFTSIYAQTRYKSFASRQITKERLVDLAAKDEWGYLDLVKRMGIPASVEGLVSYVKEVIAEFYANLPEKASADGIKVLVRGHTYEFSPAAINQVFDQPPLSKAEKQAVADVDLLVLKRLLISSYNWIPSSHRNHVSEQRARLVYKIFKGIRFDFGKMKKLEIIESEVFDKLVAYRKDARTGKAYATKFPECPSFYVPPVSSEPPSTAAPGQNFIDVELGSIRMSLVDQNDPEVVYGALIDTARVLQTLFGMIHRLTQNHPMSKML